MKKKPLWLHAPRISVVLERCQLKLNKCLAALSFNTALYHQVVHRVLFWFTKRVITCAFIFAAVVWEEDKPLEEMGVAKKQSINI